VHGARYADAAEFARVTDVLATTVAPALA